MSEFYTREFRAGLSYSAKAALNMLHDQLFNDWFEHIQEVEPRLKSESEEQWRNRVQYKTEQQVYEAIGRIICGE